MTYQEVASMIEEIGLPFSYYQFDADTEVSPPFVCFFYPYSDDVYADNLNYQRITELNIELYTDTKDFASEQKVEDVLSAHGVSYAKTEVYIDSEKLYEVIYTMEVLIHG